MRERVPFYKFLKFWDFNINLELYGLDKINKMEYFIASVFFINKNKINKKQQFELSTLRMKVKKK